MAEAKIDFAKCIISDMDALTIMKNIPLETVKSILRCMKIEYEEGLPSEAYVIALLEEFLHNREWILRIFPRKFLDFLMEVWDSEIMEMNEDRWEMVQYLKTFGLMAYRKGNEKQGEENELYIIESMKNNFYFFLKSRESRRLMERYLRWGNSFCGMTYYYGMFSLEQIYPLFCEVIDEKIDFDTFVSFIKCRADVWGIGNYLMDGNGVEYFQNHNVELSEITYIYLQEQKMLPYRKIKYEDLRYIKEGYGIDNRWAGISELGNYLIEEVHISYYRATVLVHSMLTDIQNSKSYRHIKEKFDMITFEHDGQREKAEEYLKILYDHIPIYEYKGHSRVEYQEIYRQLEWKKRKNRFIILPGGHN